MEDDPSKLLVRGNPLLKFSEPANNQGENEKRQGWCLDVGQEGPQGLRDDDHGEVQKENT